ncbi:DUF2141 domain-containing protein [Minwuia sp.]|uniref:DUF2141 domain-containing protein n=1 Tax=Minwuia sp. TaxID=2493630 RepID=UPI003A8D3BD6
MTRTFFLISALVLPLTAQAAELTVRIDNIASDQGTILVALYESPHGFLKDDGETAARSVKAMPGALEVTFADLKAGRYAVAMYHDANDDRELNRNLLGLPTEGVGFSNDAIARFGPPDFDDAAVTLSADERRSLTATLAY